MKKITARLSKKLYQFLREYPFALMCFQFIGAAFFTCIPVLLGVFYADELPLIGSLEVNTKNCVFFFLLILLWFFTFQRQRNQQRNLKNAYREAAARVAFSQAYRLIEEKRNQYIGKIQYINADFPRNTEYDSIEFIQRIGRNLESLLSLITELDEHYLSMAIIYRCGDADTWKWLLRNDLSSTFDLNEFVERNYKTVFYQLSGKHFIFYNDKKKAAEKNLYHMGRRDEVYENEGSIVGIKITMSDFGNRLVECRLTIATHGVKFTDNINLSPDELEILLLHEIFPYYQKLIETELAELYLSRNSSKSPALLTGKSDVLESLCP